MVQPIFRQCCLVLDGASKAIGWDQECQALRTENINGYGGSCQRVERLICEQVVPAWPSKESAAIMGVRELLE